MQRRYVLIAIASVAVVALGGVGAWRLLERPTAAPAALVAAKPTTCEQTYRLLKLSPSDVAQATPNCLVQSLAISGELHGSVGQAFTVVPDGTAVAPMCAVPKRWANLPEAALALTIGSKAYLLTIAPPGVSNRQPLKFDAAGKVNLISFADPSAEWNQASGAVGVDGEGIAGSLDVELARNVAGAKPVHVTGEWACGAPPPLPQFDATVPCANFYALNNLQSADVARMKSGCNVQDLTFAGDVIGHVVRAETDLSGPHTYYFGADNACGGGNGIYFATVKFSIGDESFLLELSVFHIEGIGPSQYSAAETGSSIGVVLFLGSADPAQQGLFTVDEQVWWAGQSGTFTIANDMKSGTVDADLKAPLNASTVHVSGNWRCAA